MTSRPLLLASLASLAFADGGALTIQHTPPACARAGLPARVDACFQPASSLGRARVYFRCSAGQPWRFASLRPQGECFVGALPAAGQGQQVEYYVEAVDTEARTVRTEPYSVRGIGASESCGQGGLALALAGDAAAESCAKGGGSKALLFVLGGAAAVGGGAALAGGGGSGGGTTVPPTSAVANTSTTTAATLPPSTTAPTTTPGPNPTPTPTPPPSTTPGTEPTPGPTTTTTATTTTTTSTTTTSTTTTTLPACGYTVTGPVPPTFGLTGGTGTCAVTTQTGCAWTATTDVNWISFQNAQGSGSGTISFTVALTLQARQADIVLGQGSQPTCHITQSALRSASDAAEDGSLTSELDLEGGEGQVVLDGGTATFQRRGARAVALGPGRQHRVEATVVNAAGPSGEWRFRIGAVAPGTLRIVAGRGSAAGDASLLFRLTGKPGERLVFMFRTAD